MWCDSRVLHEQSSESSMEGQTVLHFRSCFIESSVNNITGNAEKVKQ